MHEPKPLPAKTQKPAHTSSVADLVRAALPRLRDIRHDLHAHPELSYEERRTSKVVQDELRAIGVRYQAGLGKGTGVVAYLPASDPKHESKGSVALRADMDALPITEQTGTPYASKTPGVMHACGHDGHTAILLGTAHVLSKVERPRPVTLIFQPAEEGGGGGEVMCNEGVLAGESNSKKPGGIGAPVKVIFGLHGWPTIEIGFVASKPGPLLAATDDFEVQMIGTQSHGAYPHFGNDPILASAHAITALQSIVARNTSPLDSCVVSVGAIHAGTADNIIPQSVKFIGTVRTLRDATRAHAKKRFFAIVEQTAKAMGCKAAIKWMPGYPVTSNDDAATAKFFDIARATLGAKHVCTVDQPTMGGEDFAYYGKHVPACFFLLGLRPKGAKHFPTLHQPDFDFSDDALPIGVRLMCELALGA